MKSKINLPLGETGQNKGDERSEKEWQLFVLINRRLSRRGKFEALRRINVILLSADW